MNKSYALKSLEPLSLLDRFMGIIELSESQRKKAEKSYQAVTSVLRDSECIAEHVKNVDIKAQGSMRAGTTIRPQGQNAFDLDVLCVVELKTPDLSPRAFLDLMWNALGEHALYKSMRIRKERCVRLEYKGDFHLDITPAKPAAKPPLLFVPDKNVAWSSTNPIGFCDEWFLPSTQVQPSFPIAFSAANTLFNAKRADVTVEALPNYDKFEKRPLQRIVQLVKYDRDRFYENKRSIQPSSILLTTIVTRAYNDLVNLEHASMRGFVLAVIQRYPLYVKVLNGHTTRMYEVLNPVNELENFAEKWDDDTYRHFIEWHSDLMSRLSRVLVEETKGLDNTFAVIESSFPESKGHDLRGIVGRELRSLHDSGNLMVKASPSAMLPSIPVASTIFYGAN
jgi:hypothetical protein